MADLDNQNTNDVSLQQTTPENIEAALAAIIDTIAGEETEFAGLIVAEVAKLDAARRLVVSDDDLPGLNDVMRSFERMLRSIIKKNILLELKLQEVLEAATELGIDPADLEEALLAVLGSIADEESALGEVIAALAAGIFKAADEATSFEDLLDANASAERVLRSVIKKEIVLETKMQDVLDFIVTPLFPPGELCECRASFILPNNTFMTSAGGTGEGRLSRAGAPNGRVRVCRTCRPDRTELFEFEFTPAEGSDTTFVATSYDLVDGAPGSCCQSGDAIIYTLTGSGLLNGSPSTFTLVLDDEGGGSGGTADLTVGGVTYSGSVTPGSINLFSCNGIEPCNGG